MTHSAFEPDFADVRKGLRTGDNFRFVRGGWEVSGNHTPVFEARKFDSRTGKGSLGYVGDWWCISTLVLPSTFCSKLGIKRKRDPTVCNQIRIAVPAHSS